MHYKKNLTSNFALISLFLFAGLVLLCALYPLTSKSFFSFRKVQPILQNSSKSAVKDELEESLSKASTANKTVIIAIVNKAYVEPHNDQYPTMFDLFLEGFWVGEGTKSLLDHLLVVAMDQTAYDRCRFRRLNCYRLITDGVDFTEEKLYMSADFIKMMWARTLFLLDVLKHGYNFIFTDTDIIWLRNPFPKLSLNETDDLQISTDHFNGKPWSEENFINTGFYHIKANNKTISLFETWYESGKNATGLKEQDVLANLILGGVFRKLGLRVRFLDTLYFSGFCSDSRDVGAVATVHANCCRSISAKIADLTAVLKDWNKFKQSAAANSFNATNGFHWSWHIACRNSWHQRP